MSKTSNAFAAALGWAILLSLHFYGLSSIPGLHFDEAWAFNFSWKIASWPGFWPLAAMSSYTSPWTHYWAALWLKLLGPSVLVFRGSQVTLAVAGLAALCWALPRHVRVFFPWACLILPGLWLNHRFAIELNGFHVLCFGVLCLGIRERWYGAACLAALLGTTAHILFYGVALGLLGAVMLEGRELPRRARIGAMVFFAFAAAFFLKVTFEIPEKPKAAALVFSALVALALLGLQAERWKVWRMGWLRAGLFLAAAVFFLNAVFFAEGVWTASIYSGHDFWQQLHTAGRIDLFCQWAALACVSGYACFSSSTLRRNWALLSLFLMGLMMLKPAPRYFEIPFLSFAALLSCADWGFARRGGPAKAALLFVVALFLGQNLFEVGRMLSAAALHGTQDSDLHFLFFKDSSRDFLDKQSLARFLGSSGCRLNDIRTNDPRLREELEALSLGDWPMNANAENCPYFSVARASEPGATGEVFEEFLLKNR